MRILRWSHTSALLMVAIALAGVVPAAAAPPRGGKITLRTIGVEPLNETPGWLVRVAVDRRDRTYQVGEFINIEVISEQKGYLYLFNVDAEGNVGLLFPNRRQGGGSALIEANVPVRIPGTNVDRFRIKVSAESLGHELLWAVVTKEPAPELAKLALGDQGTLVPLERFREMLSRLATGDSKTARGRDLRAAISSFRRQNPRRYARQSQGWSEHKLELTTVKQRNNPVSRRVALVVGISVFKDPAIRKLGCSHKDAIRMDQVLRSHGRFDSVTRLLNSEATLAAIRAEFVKLVENTRPGDTVLFYWSGHGGRCASTDATETGGLAAYLVPHDGMLENTEGTMLLDKAFGRWIQELDGRKVLVILDTCHSGGQIEGMKAPRRLKQNRDGTPRFSRGINTPRIKRIDNGKAGKHFLDRMLFRIKSIGQKDADVLAACTFKQFAFEREEQDLGVMTFFLVQKLADGSGPLVLRDVAEYVQREVPKYAESHFPGSPQTPVFSDGTPTPKAVLRP